MVKGDSIHWQWGNQTKLLVQCTLTIIPMWVRRNKQRPETLQGSVKETRRSNHQTPLYLFRTEWRVSIRKLDQTLNAMHTNDNPNVSKKEQTETWDSPGLCERDETIKPPCISLGQNEEALNPHALSILHKESFSHPPPKKPFYKDTLQHTMLQRCLMFQHETPHAETPLYRTKNCVGETIQSPRKSTVQGGFFFFWHFGFYAWLNMKSRTRKESNVVYNLNCSWANMEVGNIIAE